MKLRTVLTILLGVALALGAWVVHILYLDHDVEISIAQWTLETPLTVVILSLVLLSILLLLAWHLFSLVAFFPYHLKSWRRKRNERRKSRLLAEGLQAMVLGIKDNQRKSFTAAADAGIAPAATYYLAAAVSKDDKQQSALLRKAARADGDPMVQAMALARSKLKDNLPSEAAEVLRIAGAATHAAIQPLRLLLEASEKSGDTRGALDIAQQLLERDPSPMLRQRIGALTSDLLQEAANADAVHGLLGSMKKKSGNQSAASVAVAAASRLAAVNDQPGASLILSQALKQSDDPEVIEAIAVNGTPELVKQTLEKTDALLKKSPSDTKLIRAFADLAMKEKLWGQARKLLENALAINEERGTYLRLAKLAEMEGMSSDEVNRLYRKAAQASSAV